MKIDESKFSRMKYGRGEAPKSDDWVFGRVERGNGANGLLEVVARRDAATLIPLIQKWILPGTIIYHVHLRCPLIKEKKALTSSVTFKFLI